MKVLINVCMVLVFVEKYLASLRWKAAVLLLLGVMDLPVPFRRSNSGVRLRWSAMGGLKAKESFLWKN